MVTFWVPVEMLLVSTKYQNIRWVKDHEYWVPTTNPLQNSSKLRAWEKRGRGRGKSAATFQGRRPRARAWARRASLGRLRTLRDWCRWQEKPAPRGYRRCTAAAPAPSSVRPWAPPSPFSILQQAQLTAVGFTVIIVTSEACALDPSVNWLPN